MRLVGDCSGSGVVCRACGGRCGLTTHTLCAPGLVVAGGDGSSRWVGFLFQSACQVVSVREIVRVTIVAAGSKLRTGNDAAKSVISAELYRCGARGDGVRTGSA